LEEKLEGGQDDGAIRASEHNKSAPHTSVNKGSGERDGVHKGGSCVRRVCGVMLTSATVRYPVDVLVLAATTAATTTASTASCCDCCCCSCLLRVRVRRKRLRDKRERVQQKRAPHMCQQRESTSFPRSLLAATAAAAGAAAACCEYEINASEHNKSAPHTYVNKGSPRPSPARLLRNSLPLHHPHHYPPPRVQVKMGLVEHLLRRGSTGPGTQRPGRRRGV